jgi:Fungal Zn(2)-Cys(6) binuclear cluster domain
MPAPTVPTHVTPHTALLKPASSLEPSSMRTSTRSQSTEAGFDEQEDEDDVNASPLDHESKQRLSTRARTRKSRISSACLECKKRRRKCTGATPCQACTLFQTECIYDRTQDRRTKAYLQKRVMDAMQSNKDEELLPVLGKNADLDSDLVSELQTAPRLAEKSIPVTSTATDPRRLVCSAFA